MDANRVLIEKLTNQNYEAWNFRMKMLLIKENLWKYVNSDPIAPVIKAATSTTPEEVTNQAAIDEWILNDSKALAIIALSVDDKQLNLIKKAETSKAAWKELQEYHQKSSLAHQASVLKKLCKLELEEDGDMELHLFQIEELFEKLSNLGKNFTEDVRVILVIQSLPESYNALTTALEARNEKELTLSLLKSKLIDEYHKQKNKDDRSEKALKVRNYTIICNYCKGEGHIKKNCPKLKLKYAKKDDSDEAGNSGNQANTARAYCL